MKSYPTWNKVIWESFPKPFHHSSSSDVLWIQILSQPLLSHYTSLCGWYIYNMSICIHVIPLSCYGFLQFPKNPMPWGHFFGPQAEQRGRAADLESLCPPQCVNKHVNKNVDVRGNLGNTCEKSHVLESIQLKKKNSFIWHLILGGTLNPAFWD